MDKFTAILAENEALFVDQDPSHYITNLGSDDFRRYADDCCVVCGLLSEYHHKSDQVPLWSVEYNKYHYQTVCSVKCKNRLFLMMDSLEKN